MARALQEFHDGTRASSYRFSLVHFRLGKILLVYWQPITESLLWGQRLHQILLAPSRTDLPIWAVRKSRPGR